MADRSSEIRIAVKNSRQAGWEARVRFASTLLYDPELVVAVLDDIARDIHGRGTDENVKTQRPMFRCNNCHIVQSPIWWHCCPSHTNPNDPDDVVCQNCAWKFHPNMKPTEETNA